MDANHAHQSDADLVARSRRDASAFGELYQRHAAAIYRYHCRCARDADAAHDLTAETFAQAWLTRARFRDEAGGSAAPWLYGIARNVVLMSVRRRRIEQAGLERLGMFGDAAALSGVEHQPDDSWLAELEAALDELPAAQREAVRLRFDADLAYDQLAVALETSPQAARVRVHRALTTLRSRLNQSTQ
ncbi:MAG TPA: sigma-70 family RNA polymerase sigma factor [Solirubrobacteraceae bacterium]|jgi:RNA polymerase sigma-70 factor (ECF subfamily)|nr:sigma-70 family RNA polymerase sigma factor [Solirubrobacteraceae bacterium]